MLSPQSIKIIITRLLLSALVTGVVCLLFSYFKHFFSQDVIQTAIKDIGFVNEHLTKYENLKKFLDSSGFKQPVRQFILVGFFYCLVFLKSKSISKTLVTQFFADYPEHLMEPVATPRLLVNPDQLAPPLVKPKGSYSERIYLELLNFVLEGTKDSSQGRLYPVSDVAKDYKFTWALITGRPGEGKSRIVCEVARQLSRRDLFGDKQLADQRQKLKKYWKRMELAFSAWFREHFPLSARTMNESGDPWDSGYLRDSALSQLEHWTPRKPTLLILDDPPYGYAAQVAKLLAAQSYRFQKPVRLFIVNQTVSSQLYVLYQQYKRSHAKVNLVVKQSAGFTDEQISVARQFVQAYKPHGHDFRQLRLDDDYRQLLTATSGNALLLELAVPLLLKGMPLYELNQETILEDRVNTVLQKLKDQDGLDEHGIHALIVATIADGPEFEHWTKALHQQLQLAIENIPGIDAIARVFPYSRKTGRLLRYRKNMDADEFTEDPPRVPVLRPDLIADQLIYRIVANYGRDAGQEIARQLIAAAWACYNSAGMLRSAERWSSQHNQLLAEAFEQSIKPEFFIDHSDYLMVVTELVLFHQKPYAMLLNALGQVSLDNFDQYLEQLTEALITPGIDRILMLQWVNHLLDSFKTNAVTDFQLSFALLNLAIACFQRLYTEYDAPKYNQAVSDLGHHCIDILQPHQYTVFERDLAILKELFEAIARQEEKAEPILKQFLTTLADLPWFSNRNDRLIWCQLRNTWSGSLAYKVKTHPECIAELQQHISQLSDELVNDESDVELYAESLTAKRKEIFYHSTQDQGVNAKQTLSLANDLDEIARSFPAQLTVIQEQRIKAWGYVIHAYCQQPAGQCAEKCVELAQQVDAIAAHFPDNHEQMQLHRAQSWCSVIYAYSKQPAGQGTEKCVELAQQVDAIAAHFPDDHELMQLQRAYSWRDVIYAYSQRPAGQDAEKCLELAQQVDAIAVNFPDDHEQMQLRRAYSWRDVIDAYSQRPAGQGAETCLELVQQVDAIAAHFPDDYEPMQLRRAESWRDVIYTFNQQPAGQGAETCLELVQQVDAIADHFPDDHELMQLERATSWRYVSFAFSQRPAGQGAETCLELAQLIDAIAALFPDDYELMQSNLAQSLCYVISAYNKQSSGQGADKCVELLQQAKDIAVRFKSNEDIQVHYSKSWRCTAQAFAVQESTTTQKQIIRKAIDNILSIALRFPDNSSIQYDEQEALQLLTRFSLDN